MAAKIKDGSFKLGKYHILASTSRRKVILVSQFRFLKVAEFIEILLELFYPIFIY